MPLDGLTPESRVSRLLGNGELEAALNVVSRYPTASDVAARVQILNGKFVRASRSLSQAGEPLAAAACALLARPNHVCELADILECGAQLSGPVAEYVVKFQSLGFVDPEAAAAISVSLDCPWSVVVRVVDECNILRVCAHADSIELATLSHFCSPGADIMSIVSVLVSEGSLNAAVDDMKGVLVMLDVNTADRATEVLERLLVDLDSLQAELPES